MSIDPGKIGPRERKNPAAAERRLRRELVTVRHMIDMYSRAHFGKPLDDSPECAELWDYVSRRVTYCPFLDNKPVCVKCTVHCYKPEMRERIRAVMRYSGPRMIGRHPLLAALHMLDRLR